MFKKYHREYGDVYQKWEHFRVVKRFTFLPLRIYQYSSQTTWWSWLETTYIFQEWVRDGGIHSYIFGGYWKNVRLSNVDEYNDYEKFKNN